MSTHLKKKVIANFYVQQSMIHWSAQRKSFAEQVIKHHLCVTFTVVLICHYKTIQLGQQKGRLYFLSAVSAQINCFILT